MELVATGALGTTHFLTPVYHHRPKISGQWFDPDTRVRVYDLSYFDYMPDPRPGLCDYRSTYSRLGMKVTEQFLWFFGKEAGKYGFGIVNPSTKNVCFFIDLNTRHVQGGITVHKFQNDGMEAEKWGHFIAEVAHI